MSFSSDVAKFVKKTNMRGDVVVRKIAFEAYARVLKRSPVDTGRFRGNWNVGIGQTDQSIAAGVPQRAEGAEHASPPTTGEEGYGNATIVRAKWGDTIIISNNLPYAIALERGHSSQASGPNAILGGAVAEVKAGLAKIVKELG